MRNATLVPALALTLFPLACATPGGPGQLIMPIVKLHDIRALRLEGDGLVAEVTMQVDNPNPFPLHMQRVSYALTFENRPTATGETNQPLDIPAKGNVLAPVTLKAPFRAGLTAGAVLLLMGEIPYTLEMKVAFATPLGPITIPVTQKGKLQLPDVPELLRRQGAAGSSSAPH